MPPRPPLQHLRRGIEFLEAATGSLGLGHWGSAVSSLYYVTFHLALGLLSTQGISPATHRGVKEMFSLSFVVDGPLPRPVGRMLSQLMADRESATYSVAEEIDGAIAFENAARALAFLEATLPLLAQRAPETAAALPDLTPLRSRIAAYTAST